MKSIAFSVKKLQQSNILSQGTVFDTMTSLVEQCPATARGRVGPGPGAERPRRRQDWSPSQSRWDAGRWSRMDKAPPLSSVKQQTRLRGKRENRKRVRDVRKNWEMS